MIVVMNPLMVITALMWMGEEECTLKTKKQEQMTQLSHKSLKQRFLHLSNTYSATSLYQHGLYQYQVYKINVISKSLF